MKIKARSFWPLCKRKFSCLMPAILMALAMTLGGPLYGRGESGAGGKVTLTIAGRDGAYGDAMQLAADKYKKLNPNVSFEILKLSGASLFVNIACCR